MYKCLECGCEYETKPDFCDCGNDSFKKIDAVTKDFSNVQKDAPVKIKKSFDEQYPELSRFLKTLDPISVAIFTVCIILSICSFIFIKPNEKTAQTVVKKEKIASKVADINSFWNDTPPKQQIKEIAIPTEEVQIANQIKDIISKVTEPQPVNKTTVNQTTQKQPVKAATANVSKTSKTAQPQTQKQAQKNTQQKISPKTQQNQQTQKIQSQSQTIYQPQPNQQKPIQQVQQTQQPVITTPITQTAQTNTQTIKGAEDFNNYKNGLRNLIGRKIDFTKVYGNGSCIVEFKINSNGQLTNKKFTRQSENNTLNDEVFKAVNTTYSYKNPPSSYSGGLLHLVVKFSNGNYSVTLN